MTCVEIASSEPEIVEYALNECNHPLQKYSRDFRLKILDVIEDYNTWVAFEIFHEPYVYRDPATGCCNVTFFGDQEDIDLFLEYFYSKSK